MDTEPPESPDKAKKAVQTVRQQSVWDMDPIAYIDRLYSGITSKIQGGISNGIIRFGPRELFLLLAFAWFACAVIGGWYVMKSDVLGYSAYHDPENFQTKGFLLGLSSLVLFLLMLAVQVKYLNSRLVTSLFIIFPCVGLPLLFIAGACAEEWKKQSGMADWAFLAGWATWSLIFAQMAYILLIAAIVAIIEAIKNAFRNIFGRRRD